MAWLFRLHHAAFLSLERVVTSILLRADERLVRILPLILLLQQFLQLLLLLILKCHIDNISPSLSIFVWSVMGVHSALWLCVIISCVIS